MAVDVADLLWIMTLSQCSGLGLDRVRKEQDYSRNGAWPHFLLLKLEAVGKFDQEDVVGMEA